MARGQTIDVCRLDKPDFSCDPWSRWGAWRPLSE
jgi:hypothetical protein